MQKGQQVQKKLEMAGGIFFCLLGFLFICSGGKVNYDANRIREEGIKVQADILKKNVDYGYIGGLSLKHIYLVKFTVEGKERIGRAVTPEDVYLDEYVYIYYLPDSLDDEREEVDVVIESKRDYDGPGGHKIDYGIFFMTVGAILFLYAKDR